LISAEAPPQTLLGKLTVLPRPPSCIYGDLLLKGGRDCRGREGKEKRKGKGRGKEGEGVRVRRGRVEMERRGKVGMRALLLWKGKGAEGRE